MAAYCRVSSQKDEQLHSYEVQTSYYTEKIANNPEWKMVRIYADEGISGTSLRKREDFKRMIRACREGKIDLILVKSVARFGRNIVDILRTVRSLQERGVGVIFEKEGIDTRKMNSEMMLAFHSAFSQSESESLSGNVGRGTMMARSLGKFSIPNSTYGFTKDAEGNIILDPKQAEVLRLIGRWYLDGKSLREICAELERQGVPSPSRTGQWRSATVKGYLQDVKYKGDYVYGRTYKPTVLSKKPVKNHGERPMVIIRDALPRVFEPEIFQRIQTEMAKREAKRPISENAKTPFGRYSGKYALSGILICGKCGSLYRRVVLRPRGKMTVVWKCGSHQDLAANCPESPALKETALQTAIMEAIRSEYLAPAANEETMLTAIREVLSPSESGNESKLRSRLADLNKQRQELIAKALDSEDDEMYDLMFQRILEETAQIRQQLEGIQQARQDHSEADARMEEIQALVARFVDEPPEYDDVLVRKAVEAIRVKSAETLEITFRDGRTVMVSLK